VSIVSILQAATVFFPFDSGINGYLQPLLFLHSVVVGDIQIILVSS